MALANAIMAGSYTTVKIVSYDQHVPMVTFTATVWQDSSKIHKIAELRYQFKDYEPYDTLPNKGVDSLPLAPEINDEVLVGPNPSGDLAPYEHGTVLAWLGSENGWVRSKKLDLDHHYYIEDEDKFSRWTGSGFYDLNYFFTPSIWASYFDIAKLDEAGMTLIKGCYEWLKTTNEFKNCVDA